MTDYMPDPERSVDYKLLDPGFTKVFAFGTQFGQLGYIIADSREDAYEELEEHAYDADGPCDHGDPPELKTLIELEAWDAAYNWIDKNCDCTSMSRGYVWMVDSWWLSYEPLPIKPLELLTRLRAITSGPELNARLDQHIEWYSEGEDDDA